MQTDKFCLHTFKKKSQLIFFLLSLYRTIKIFNEFQNKYLRNAFKQARIFFIRNWLCKLACEKAIFKI